MAFALNRRTGKLRWSFDSRTDIHEGWWPTMMNDHVVLNDDGLFVLDANSGKKMFHRGVDWWGDLLFADQRLALTNTWHVHGPFLQVGSYDTQARPIWTIEHRLEGQDYRDRAGTLTWSHGRLFFGQRVHFTAFEGLFALDAKTGHVQWSRPAGPTSAISADESLLFFTERHRNGQTYLVAVRQDDGTLAWSAKTEPSDGAAPAVFRNQLLSITRSGQLTTRNKEHGKIIWKKEISDADLGGETGGHNTHIAIASLSETVVVSSGSNLSVLDAKTGKQRWRAPSNRQDIFHSPIIGGGMVLVTHDRDVQAWMCARP